MAQSPAPGVLIVRVSPKERQLLESAAARARTSLSAFIRRKAIDAAEAAMLERATVTIPARDWKRFEAWVKTPAKEIPALRKLAKRAPAWQD